MKFRNDAAIDKVSLIKLNYLSKNEVQFYRVHYELVTQEGGTSTNKIQLNVHSSLCPSGTGYASQVTATLFLILTRK